MRTIKALAAKDLRLLLRDKPGFFFTFFFPILYASFFGLIMAGDDRGSKEIKILAVDEDQSDSSRSFISRLDKTAEMAVTPSDLTTAEDQVRLGKSVAYVLLPKGFGDAMRNPFKHGFPNLEAGIDPGRPVEKGMLTGLLTMHVFESLFGQLANPKFARQVVNESVADIKEATIADPLTRATLLTFLGALDSFLGSVIEEKEENTEAGGAGNAEAAFGFPKLEIGVKDVQRKRFGPRTFYDISFPQGVTWALLSCSAAFGISLVVERTRGTLVRLRMSPAPVWKILAGKATACFITTLGVSTFLLLFARIVFGVRPLSPLLLVAPIVSASLCFVGIMMFLSVLGKTEQSAGGIGWAILSVMAMLGGGMLPLVFMPAWMQRVGSVSPVKWAIYAMEGAIWRDFSAAEMMLPCGILVGIGAVFFLIGAIAFNWVQKA